MPDYAIILTYPLSQAPVSSGKNTQFPESLVHVLSNLRAAFAVTNPESKGLVGQTSALPLTVAKH
jgi:hypothetical protein